MIDEDILRVVASTIDSSLPEHRWVLVYTDMNEPLTGVLTNLGKPENAEEFLRLYLDMASRTVPAGAGTLDRKDN